MYIHLHVYIYIHICMYMETYAFVSLYMYTCLNIHIFFFILITHRRVRAAYRFNMQAGLGTALYSVQRRAQAFSRLDLALALVEDPTILSREHINIGLWLYKQEALRRHSKAATYYKHTMGANYWHLRGTCEDRPTTCDTTRHTQANAVSSLHISVFKRGGSHAALWDCQTL